jgi:hypothetical protein
MTRQCACGKTIRGAGWASHQRACTDAQRELERFLADVYARARRDRMTPAPALDPEA